MLGGGLPVVRYGIDVAAVPFSPLPGEYLVTVGRLVPHKGADRAIAIAERAGLPLVIVGDVTPYLEESEPFYEERIRPHVDGGASGTTAALPNDEVLALVRRRAGVPLPDLLGGAVRPRRRRGARRGHARRRDAPRARCRSSSSTASRAFSARPTRSSPASWPGSESSTATACRRRAEERFGYERMVSDYEALYRKILGR